ncbi:NADAR family protein [Halomonas aquamarina]|uniref:NADAR family protein n=1 Tax=Vreelandella aquamarina TaxID=77097 RepID=A0ACC5VVJ3_9GAMM|nr:NADAR family protein [Halomonas aquamarina]MBZ5488168.1 NADAR family protein [Halomonas aquamarina]
MMRIRTIEALKKYVNGGNNIKYLFFWGHQRKGAEVSKTCFSQWYTSAFETDGVTYLTAEHFMMAEKARLFNDSETHEKIIHASNPGKAKALGREIRSFDESVWIEHRFDIVVKANYLKFDQNHDLKTFLLNTGDRVLVEASPVDNIWGVGLAVDHPDIENPNRWSGLNLLGFALMEVRDILRHSNE